MNKSKIVLAATGGAIGIVVLVMAFLVWRAFSAKSAAIEGDEENEGLETVVESANSLSRKPVYPSAESVKAVASNEALVAEWKGEAFKLASRGDRPVKAMTAAQFKTDMVSEAKRLVDLPGGVQGKIAKPDFPFGPFREYIAEGKMPSEGRLPELQRQWDDLTTIVETLSANGAFELVDLQLKAVTEAKPDESAAKGKRRPARKAKGDEAADAFSQPSRQDYVITFTTRPLGFVKILNALETNERFFIVEDFTFLREKDVIAEALGGGDKKEAAQQQSGGRRRRRGQVAEAAKPEDGEKPKNGIITDPLLDAPFKVTLTLVSYDFKTLQVTAKENEEEKK